MEGIKMLAFKGGYKYLAHKRTIINVDLQRGIRKCLPS